MNKIILGLSIAILFVGCQSSKQKQFNILDYGAKENRLSTKAIQAAIDDCNKNGGGTVYVPSGEFITGTVFLKSNVNLYLEQGAVVKGSSDIKDYESDGKDLGLLFGENLINVSISGSGVLDANGTYFHKQNVPHIGEIKDYDVNYTRQKEDFMNPDYGLEDGPIAYDKRPYMQLILRDCEGITLKDFTMKDAPHWSIRLANCEDVAIEGIRIFNNLDIPNSDGIHLTRSRNVRISNCDLRCGDDAIVVTGFPFTKDEINRPYDENRYGNLTEYSENITVANCVLQSRSAGIRVGYGHYPIRNCVFSNLVIYGSNRGIGVFARESEAVIENIYFDNIIITSRLHKGHWWGKGEPIHISSIDAYENNTAGIIKNIQFTNITAESETGVVIWGERENTIQNIRFNNVQLTIKESPISDIYGGNFDLRPTSVMEKAIFEHDIPAIYVRNTDGLLLKDVTVKWEGNFLPFYTYALECDKVDNLVLERFTGNSAQADLPLYKLKNTTKQ